MAKFRAGKNSSAVISSQTLALKEWTTSYAGDPLDTSNFESNGKKQWLTGLVGVDWTVRGDWDASANPLDDPPGLYPRDDGENAQLYTNNTDNKYWEFPLFLVANSDISTSVSGTVTFNASCKSSGDFTAPEGST